MRRSWCTRDGLSDFLVAVQSSFQRVCRFKSVDWDSNLSAQHDNFECFVLAGDHLMQAALVWLEFKACGVMAQEAVRGVFLVFMYE